MKKPAQILAFIQEYGYSKFFELCKFQVLTTDCPVRLLQLEKALNLAIADLSEKGYYDKPIYALGLEVLELITKEQPENA